MKEFYATRVSSVQTTDKPCWQHLVHKVVVDETFQKQPKVYYSAEEELKLKAHKRMADGNLGPDHTVPSSVERKPKGPRHDHDDTMNTDSSGEEEEDEEDEAVLESSDYEGPAEEEVVEEIQKEPTEERQRKKTNRPPLAPKNINESNVQGGAETGSTNMDQAGKKKKQRKVGCHAATGYKENLIE